jgi:hypothetical protein
LGIFDKAYAKATAGSTYAHTYVAPDLFTAETPLGRPPDGQQEIAGE